MGRVTQEELKQKEQYVRKYLNALPLATNIDVQSAVKKKFKAGLSPERVNEIRKKVTLAKSYKTMDNKTKTAKKPVQEPTTAEVRTNRPNLEPEMKIRFMITDLIPFANQANIRELKLYKDGETWKLDYLVEKIEQKSVEF